jgi:hypothetical protein
MSIINLAISEEEAFIFDNISDVEKQQISTLVTDFLKSIKTERKSRAELLQVMAEIAAEAKANGLTEEILQEILSQND